MTCLWKNSVSKKPAHLKSRQKSSRQISPTQENAFRDRSSVTGTKVSETSTEYPDHTGIHWSGQLGGSQSVENTGNDVDALECHTVTLIGRKMGGTCRWRQYWGDEEGEKIELQKDRNEYGES